MEDRLYVTDIVTREQLTTCSTSHEWKSGGHLVRQQKHEHMKSRDET